eukprot:sb/3478851/
MARYKRREKEKGLEFDETDSIFSLPPHFTFRSYDHNKKVVEIPNTKVNLSLSLSLSLLYFSLSLSLSRSTTRTTPTWGRKVTCGNRVKSPGPGSCWI